jgi:hypothetical protein
VTLVDKAYLVVVMADNIDRPVLLVGSGRCGSTLLQSVLNTNPEFLIWGEHNGFLRQIAAAYYDAPHPRFPDQSALDAADRIKKLRSPRHWPAWDNLCGAEEFRERFRALIRSFFADPMGRAVRWGFKEIRYGQTPDDRTLRLMFECFPETRLIILVREPEATIFSVLSHWAFADQRRGNIDIEDLDRQILASAGLWNAQYTQLQAVAQAHRANCRSVRYEDLGSSATYHQLSKFLETSSFNYRSQIEKVKDASNKTDLTALLIQGRIASLRPQIEAVTSDARAPFGYSSTPQPTSPAAG